MQRAVQVLVDEPAIDREFTYLLPPELAAGRVPVTVGTIVRVPLGGRTVRGWVTELDAPEPDGVELLPVARVSSVGPPSHVVELADWAAWRWAGTQVHFLRTASADRVVAGLPGEPARWPDIPPPESPGRPAPSAAPATVGTPAPSAAPATPATVGAPATSATPATVGTHVPPATPATPARSATPATPATVGTPAPSATPATVGAPDWVRAAWPTDAQAPSVVRLGPCADEWLLVVEALRHGRSLVLVPTVAWAARLAGRLRQAGVSAALVPRDWAGAASAHAVVGTRAGAWAPCGRLDAVVVLDEHDEAYQSEAAPTWNARDVAVERARRDSARCLLVGPMPSPDALVLSTRSAADPPPGTTLWAASATTSHPLPAAIPEAVSPVPQQAGSAIDSATITTPRPIERESWPQVHIADRRQDDPAAGEWCGEALADLLRSDRTVVCVLNRTGRARLAYCASCGELACSDRSGRALRLEGRQFVDPETGVVRPAVCEACGATRFRRVRVGVKGVAEEMERLARRPVIQVVGEKPARSGTTDGSARTPSRRPQAEGPVLYIGTEAVLHRVPSADTVVFVDFDQELTAPRYRAAEEAFALLVRAARLVGPRSGGGSILVQTRLPAHPALLAAAEADPSAWVDAEAQRRSAMRQPPAAAWALVSGAAAATYVERLAADAHADAFDIDGPADGTWRVRSHDQAALLDALKRTGRPAGRLRIAVDPLRA